MVTFMVQEGIIINEQVKGYSFSLKVLHWLSAIIIFGLFGLGFWMVELDYYSPYYQSAPALHKSIGICYVVLLFARLVIRAFAELPSAIDSHHPIERAISSFVHRFFYFLLLLIVISGYLISTADGRAISVFELFEIPSLGSFVENQEDYAGDIHKWLAYGLIGLAVIHALAAIKHQFVDKDQTLKRMF